MKNYSIIFPGQGAQKPGMGKDLYDNSSAAKEVFETANSVLGYDISDLCFNGSEDDLKKTINSQPCILTVSLAALEALKEKAHVDVKAYAGHSLGEYAALYAAGAVDLSTVLKLIQKRAYYMNEAAESMSGSMAAVIGLDNETVINITENIENVYIANFNSPGQVVITGDKDSINNSIENYKSAGAKKVIPLAVSGAFHSPMMKNAREEFSQFLTNYEFEDVSVPVYTNVDARASYLGKELKEKLPKQISSSVMWTQTIDNMLQKQINNFIEIGPGKVLAGLNKKINPEIQTLNIYDWESLLSVVQILEEEKEFV